LSGSRNLNMLLSQLQAKCSQYVELSQTLSAAKKTLFAIFQITELAPPLPMKPISMSSFFTKAPISSIQNILSKKQFSTMRKYFHSGLIFLVFGLCICFSISADGQTVIKQLYLSDPDQALDRVHPGLVSPADLTTVTSATLGDGAVGSFSTPTDVSSQLGANSITPDLAVFEADGVETLHMVFLSKDGGADKLNIYYSSKTGAGAWSTPVEISSDLFGNDAEEYPSVAVDAEGVVHVVYGHKKGTDNRINIYYVTNDGGSWSAPERISSDAFGKDAFTPEIAMDAAGNAYVVYVHKSSTDAKTNTYFVTNTGGSWSTPVRISSDAFNQDLGLNPAIAIDGLGKAHVAYTHKNGASDAKVNIYYVTNTSGSWSTPARISSDAFNQDALANPSIAVDKNDKPHVVYAHKNGASDSKVNIYYTNKTGASWSAPFDLSNDQNGQDSANPDLAISGAGILRVAFSNHGENIFYTENSGAGSSWTTLVDINPLPAKSTDGNNPSVAFSGTKVHVAYEDKHNTLSGDVDVWHTSASLQGGVVAATTFNQTPVLCSDLTLPAGETITITLHTNVTSGSMPGSPEITAALADSTGIPFITLTNPVYVAGAGSTGTLTWTGTLAGPLTLGADNAISLEVATCQSGVNFTIEYDSSTKPSNIALPTSTYINIEEFAVYDAAYPGGNALTSGLANTNNFIRATVTDPFGATDITGVDIDITPPGGTSAATLVASPDACTRIYELPWTAPSVNGFVNLEGTAKEGYEGTVTDQASINFEVCTDCPPSAIDDFASGQGGVALDIDVLANDSDPNNNLDVGSLKVVSPPENGTVFVQNGKLIYNPNGDFNGQDVFTYEICDLTSPTPLCSQAEVTVDINFVFVDACSEANLPHTYFIPYPEQDARTAMINSSSTGLTINDVRTIISIKVPYPSITIAWDHWEDGLESDIKNPTQLTTQIWGDGDLTNGVAPGYATDVIPAGGSIVLDNTMPANPRVASNIFYDGRDKIVSSAQITMTQVLGEVGTIAVRSMKTNISSTLEFGQSFTIPVGEDFPSDDFKYTSLFIRAAQDGTDVQIDKDNNGTFETVFSLDEGESFLVDGGVLTGATILSTALVGVDLHFGGVDNYSSREAPVYPATWYSNTYYSPVPTTGPGTVQGTDVMDEAVVMLFNSLDKDITINWSRGVGTAPNSGTITLPGANQGANQKAIRFKLDYSNTDGDTRGAAYKFVNPTGESFVAVQIVDSYTPSPPPDSDPYNSGTTRDWSFNLIAENRLTDFATVAWAPGSQDNSTNDNPIWVTPTDNTTVYVKWDGNVLDGPTESPCGLFYDDVYTVDALTHLRLRDNSDNDQSGIAIYTCDDVKMAVVYGEDPATASGGFPSWDVGTTVQPFCKTKLVFANEDFVVTPPDVPVLIGVLDNDDVFLTTLDPSSVTTAGLTQPANGTITVNPDGTILYTPNMGFLGTDVFEYQVCSLEDPTICDIAEVTVLITDCNANANNALINGFVYLEQTPDNGAYDGEATLAGRPVHLYTDGGVIGVIDGADVMIQTKVTSAAGAYTFAVTAVGNYLVRVDVSDGNYTAATLNIETAAVSALNTCVNDLYLGVRPVLTAIDDVSTGGVDAPQVISILDNDLGVPDPSTITTAGLQQPANGTVTINPDGTVTYTPNPGYIGTDQFEYQVCSEEDPGLCDIAVVDITVSCIFVAGKNVMTGSIFEDMDLSSTFDSGESLFPNVTVNLYEDTNGNGMLDGVEGTTPAQTTTTTDGTYSFEIDPPLGPVTPFSRTVSDPVAGGDGTDDGWEEDDGKMDLGNGKLQINDQRLYIGTRFTNVTIPQGAQILSASVTFTASDNDSDPIDLQISAQAANNPGTFLDVDFNLSSRWDATNTVDWNGVEAWVKDNTHNTPDITTIIQTLVDRPGWASGNAMALLVRWVSGDQRRAYAWDDDPATAPVLNITYRQNNYPVSYITQVDLTSLPTDAVLTTDNIEAATFTAVDQSDCNNNFGVAAADLVTVKTLASGNATPGEGDVVTFLITVTNDGPTNASNVSLTDLLPAGLTATGNNGMVSQGTYAAGTWTIGTLASGASATLTLEGTVDVGQNGNTIQNITSAASGDQPDTNTTGDDLEESVVVASVCVSPPTVSLSAAGGSTCVTTPITISSNTFGGSATQVTITEDGAGSVSPTSTGTSPFSFTYTPAAGDAGNTVTITVTTDNPAGAPCVAAVETYLLTVDAAPIISNVASTDPTTCSGTDGTITIDGLTDGVAYTLNYDQDGSAQTAISFTASGTTYQMTGLPAGSVHQY
jgi:uncharacterized repeat protein (TIGR01451 family)